jgi:hypothetical protein
MFVNIASDKPVISALLNALRFRHVLRCWTAVLLSGAALIIACKF